MEKSWQDKGEQKRDRTREKDTRAVSEGKKGGKAQGGVKEDKA